MGACEARYQFRTSRVGLRSQASLCALAMFQCALAALHRGGAFHIPTLCPLSTILQTQAAPSS